MIAIFPLPQSLWIYSIKNCNPFDKTLNVLYKVLPSTSGKLNLVIHYICLLTVHFFFFLSFLLFFLLAKDVGLLQLRMCLYQIENEFGLPGGKRSFTTTTTKLYILKVALLCLLWVFEKKSF